MQQSLSFSLPLTVTPTSPQGLLRSGNWSYVGAFRVPNYYDASGEMSFGGSVLAYNAANNSLFVIGFGGADNQPVCEISIPAALNNTDLTQLNTATVLQNWTSILSRLQNPIQGASDGTSIGDLKVINGKLVGTAYAYYSGADTQITSHFVVSSLTLSAATVSGMFAVNGGRLLAGVMCPVPQAWQSQLGAPWLTGGCDIPIISTTSSGPCAFGFDPARLGLDNPVASVPYLYYPVDNPLGTYSLAFSPIQTGTTSLEGVIFVGDTVLFIGLTGTSFCGYGNGADGGDPFSSGKGPWSLNGAYMGQMWAYDAHDFLAVKQGTKQPWQVMPYDVWNFTLPIWQYRIGGVAFDAANGLLYVTATGADRVASGSNLPVIHVLKLDITVVPSPNPHIGCLAAIPSSIAPGAVAAGTPIVLNAGNVFGSSPVAQVMFYKEQISVPPLGSGTQGADNAASVWTLANVPTTGWPSGMHTVVAQAKDSQGRLSDPVTTSITIA